MLLSRKNLIQRTARSRLKEKHFLNLKLNDSSTTFFFKGKILLKKEAYLFNTLFLKELHHFNQTLNS